MPMSPVIINLINLITQKRTQHLIQSNQFISKNRFNIKSTVQSRENTKKTKHKKILSRSNTVKTQQKKHENKSTDEG